MNCTTEYNEKFNEILSLVDLAEDPETRLSNVQLGAICRSGLVLLCGYFEGYLREMCKEYTEQINDSGLIAKKLPDSILSEHSSYCLEKIKTNNMTPFSEFISAIGAEGVIELNSKRFSATNANPTVENLERLFTAFDIPLVLDSLTLDDFEIDDMYNLESHVSEGMSSKIFNLVGGNVTDRNAVLTLIEARWPPKRKRRRVGYLALIDELLKKRNRIAHGEGDVSITTTELRDTTVGIRKLCDRLIGQLDEKFSEMTL